MPLSLKLQKLDSIINFDPFLQFGVIQQLREQNFAIFWPLPPPARPPAWTVFISWAWTKTNFFWPPSPLSYWMTPFHLQSPFCQLVFLWERGVKTEERNSAIQPFQFWVVNAFSDPQNCSKTVTAFSCFLKNYNNS